VSIFRSCGATPSPLPTRHISNFSAAVWARMNIFACSRMMSNGSYPGKLIAMLPICRQGTEKRSFFLIVSYGEDSATEICRKIRAILRANWYCKAFPKTILARDQKAARDFATTAGGRVYAASIDGAITGVPCDYLLVDDPVQIRDSGNRSHLASVNARFDTDLVSRLNNPRTGTIVVVHHRLNQADLTGYLQNRRNFFHRALPLVASEDRDFRLRNGVWRRKKGDVLRPDAYTPDYIADLRENTGQPGFAPLYQQSFDGSDVIQISRDNFITFSTYAQPAVPYILSIDPNHKGQVGQSYSVVQCWALLANGTYLLYDQWRGRAHNAVFCSLVGA
jgi:hypothetical protein